MSEADVIADLKRSLHDSATVFNAAADADFKRFLSIALSGMQAKRPRTLLGTVTLVAEQDVYALTATDFAQYKTHQWGSKPPKPWSPTYPGALPRVTVAQTGTGWQMVFDPAPSWSHINAYGSTFRYWYFGSHSLGATAEDATLADTDRPLLLLRAQAEAMRELTMRNINKPVQLRDGLAGTPRNSTPAALYRDLLAEWEAAR